MDATAFPVTPDRVRFRWGSLVLVLVVCGTVLPGLVGLPLLNPREARFAFVTRAMMESGDRGAIRSQGVDLAAQSVGLHALQAAVVGIAQRLGLPDARETIWLYRLPSLLGAILATLATYWGALALTTPRGAFAAALLTAASAALVVEAQLATAGAVLCGAVTWMMASLGRIYLGDGFRGVAMPAGLRLPLVFWAALGVGTLVAGPIAALIAGAAIAVLCCTDRSMALVRRLRPEWGIALLLALLGPMFVAVAARNGTAVFDLAGMGEIVDLRRPYGLPPGAVLAALLITAWPLAPLALLAIAPVWRRRREPRLSFLLAWLVPGWLVLEFLPNKRPADVLPLIPAIAMATAVALEQAWRTHVPPRRLPTLLTPILLAGPPLGLAVAVAANRALLWDETPRAVLVGGVLVLVVTVGLAAWAARSVHRRRLASTVFATTALALIVFPFVFGRLLTPAAAARLDLPARLAATARLALGSDCPTPMFASVGYREPSLMFLTRTDLRLTDARAAADLMRQSPCGVVFVSAEAEPDFRSAADDVSNLQRVGQVSGTALNGLKSLDISVYVRQRQRP